MDSANGYANPMALVSTDWVAEHLHDADVRLLEVDVDTTAYERGHIAGAVGINWTTQLGDRIRRDIPSRSAWEQLMSQSRRRQSDPPDLLRRQQQLVRRVRLLGGHACTAIHNVALMNGGRKKWELEQRPLTTDAGDRQADHVPRPREPDFGLRAYLKDVLERPAAHDAGRRALAGRVQRRDHRAAGPARNRATLRPHSRRPEHPVGPGCQRRRHLQESPTSSGSCTAPKASPPTGPVIAYCRIGERSSHTWFVLKELLGFPNVRNYDGSWTEYGSVIGVPIDNPAAARELASASA